MFDAAQQPLEELVGHVVVLDLSSPYVIVGKLAVVQPEFLMLRDVDVHDLRDSPATREKYVLDCREHGIRPNRRQAWINARELVALSRLEDVILD